MVTVDIKGKHIAIGATTVALCLAAIVGITAGRGCAGAASANGGYTIPDRNGDGIPELAIPTNRFHTDVMYSVGNGQYVTFEDQSVRSADQYKADVKYAKSVAVCRQSDHPVVEEEAETECPHSEGRLSVGRI